MTREITIKSFNGIGDLLFVTPTLKMVKTSYPQIKIKVNTNFPALLSHNPYVDEIGMVDEGLFLGYPDPIHCIEPKQHHILSDWEIVTNHFDLVTPPPQLRPEIYCRNGYRKIPGIGIGVQMEHKGQWGGKKVWPYCEDLVRQVSCAGHMISPIPHLPSLIELVAFIAGLRLVVCCEGGVHHIARAVGTPAIVIFGGMINPEWTGYKTQLNLTNKKECSYCWNPSPCVANHECMREITVEQVIEAIHGMLE